MRVSTLLAFAAGTLVAATPLCPQAVAKAAVACIEPLPTDTLDYQFALKAHKKFDGPDSRPFPLGFSRLGPFAPLIVGYPSDWELKKGQLRVSYGPEEGLFFGQSPIKIFPPRVAAVPESLAIKALVRYRCIDDKVRAFLDVGIPLAAELGKGAPVFLFNDPEIALDVEIVESLTRPSEYESTEREIHWDIL